MQKSAFEVASDAFNTFKRLLTQHDAVAEFLQDNHSRFFKLYEQLLQSKNYATQRQVRPPPQPPVAAPSSPDLMPSSSFVYSSRFLSVNSLERCPWKCTRWLYCWLCSGPGAEHLLTAQRTATCSM